MEIEQTLDEIAAFFEKAAQVEGVKAAKDELEPASDADIDAFAQEFALTIPDDVRRFWRRGLRYRHLSIDSGGAGFATAGFDWYSLEYLARDIPMNRNDLAPLYEADTDERRLLENGFPLSFEEPQLVWDPRGGITHFSTRNDLQPPVAHSLAEFFEHWLEAGCFSSHAVTKWLPKIQHLVPGRIPPDKNLWITYYKRVFAKYA